LTCSRRPAARRRRSAWSSAATSVAVIASHLTASRSVKVPIEQPGSNACRYRGGSIDSVIAYLRSSYHGALTATGRLTSRTSRRSTHRATVRSHEHHLADGEQASHHKRWQDRRPMTIRWHQLAAKALGGSPFALNIRLRQRHTARFIPTVPLKGPQLSAPSRCRRTQPLLLARLPASAGHIRCGRFGCHAVDDVVRMNRNFSSNGWVARTCRGRPGPWTGSKRGLIVS
jgi:hypothetical protein